MTLQDKTYSTFFSMNGNVQWVVDKEIKQPLPHNFSIECWSQIIAQLKEPVYNIFNEARVGINYAANEYKFTNI